MRLTNNIEFIKKMSNGRLNARCTEIRLPRWKIGALKSINACKTSGEAIEKAIAMYWGISDNADVPCVDEIISWLLYRFTPQVLERIYTKLGEKLQEVYPSLFDGDLSQHQIHPNKHLSLKVEYGEVEVGKAIKAAGGVWDKQQKV